MFKKKKTVNTEVDYRKMFEYYEQELFARILTEYIKEATELTNINLSKVIEWNIGFVKIKLKKKTQQDDTTIIKEKTFSLRGLPELIVKKESIIEGIRKYFVEER